MTRATRKTAALYLRISRDDEGNGLGTARQEGELRQLAETLGLDVVDTFRDDGISATSGAKRPGYEALCQAIGEGRFGAVLAWHTDRINRNIGKAVKFYALVREHGVDVRTVQAGKLDLVTPAGRLQAHNLAAASEYEAGIKSERQLSKHLELARAGRPASGRRVFGWADGARTELEPTEAAAIRDAADRVIAGQSVNSIAADWNARGVVTSEGGEWRPTRVRDLLVSDRVAGIRTHKGVSYPAAWPAILDDDTARRCRAILTDPRRRTNAGPRRKYLLTGGLAVCALCSAALVARGGAYVCAKDRGGCGGIRAKADGFEADAVARLFAYADGPELARRLAEREAEAVAAADQTDPFAEVAVLRERLDGYQSLASTLEPTEYLAITADVREQLADAQARADSLAERSALPVEELAPGVLAETWPAMTADERRRMFAAVVEAVRVGPAVRGRRGYDPSRVEVAWR